MKRTIVLGLLLTLILFSNLSAQSVTVSSEDWTLLLATYQTLKAQWENSNSLVSSLESDLQTVRQQQQDSEQTINSLESSLELSDQNLKKAEQQRDSFSKRIESLEKQLQEASTQRDQLQTRLGTLETRLIALAKSLTDTQVTADNAMAVIEDNLTSVLGRYERKVALLKWGTGIAGVVAVIEAVVIGIRTISK